MWSNECGQMKWYFSNAGYVKFLTIGSKWGKDILVWDFAIKRSCLSIYFWLCFYFIPLPNTQNLDTFNQHPQIPEFVKKISDHSKNPPCEKDITNISMEQYTDITYDIKGIFGHLNIVKVLFCWPLDLNNSLHSCATVLGIEGKLLRNFLCWSW